MSNWLLVVYRDWLVHIVHRLKLELLKQRYLHIDETHVQVLKEPGRKNTSDSYMWVYCSIRDAVNPIRYFEYQPGRSGKYPEAFLREYEGYIHTDAYSGYNAVSGVGFSLSSFSTVFVLTFSTGFTSSCFLASASLHFS